MKMTRVTAIVVAFTVVGVLVASTLLVVFSGGQPRGPGFSALFADASGIKVGSDVRVAGVTVGRVTDIGLTPGNLAKLEFEVEPGVELTTATDAAIKYKNLVGDRYLALSQGADHAPPLRVGGIIPVERSKPALSLNELFNGFTPLFEGLQPQQVNQLSSLIISTFQGEGASVNNLLTEIGTLTGTLADRGQVIRSLIDNLNGVLGTLHDHGDQLNEFVVQLTALVNGLSNDRQRIGRSLDGINNLATSLGGLVHETRPDITATVHELDRTSTLLNADAGQLDGILKKLPGDYQVLGRLGIYASAFQFYLCGVRVRYSVGDTTVMSPMIQNEVGRCHF
jgi:phospholipid/cholesterol/gamma-HCH transport system substrate-binding protein